jgi:hypothetical protein
MNDCPICGAIAPAHGEIEHRRDCPESTEQRWKRDPWENWIPTSSALGGHAELLRIARACERGWDARKERGKAAGAGWKD